MYSKVTYNPTYRQEFADYLAELRIRFKPKRNFIKLLDEVSRRTG
jgi:hypothetical protein